MVDVIEEPPNPAPLKPNAWKFATICELTTYERTRCEVFEPSEYVVVEMYVDPDDFQRDTYTSWDRRIGSTTKKVKVLGFLDITCKPLPDIEFARGICDRNFIYAPFDSRTGNPFVIQPKYPNIWFSPNKFRLSSEVCQNIPHYHIIRYCEMTDKQAAAAQAIHDPTKK